MISQFTKRLGLGRSWAGSEVRQEVTTPSKFDDERGDEETRSLWADLGLPEPAYLDERLAPKVDRELLVKLVRNELPASVARVAYRLIVMFASWSDVHDEVLAEKARRRREQN